MIGRQARPCMNLLGMYRRFGVVREGLSVSLPFLLFGDFWSPFLVIFLWWFRGPSIWELLGDVFLNPSWFFSL
jgi:hypothetical protein